MTSKIQPGGVGGWGFPGSELPNCTLRAHVQSKYAVFRAGAKMYLYSPVELKTGCSQIHRYNSPFFCRPARPSRPSRRLLSAFFPLSAVCGKPGADSMGPNWGLIKGPFTRDGRWTENPLKGYIRHVQKNSHPVWGPMED